MPPDDYPPRVRAVCTHRNVLLIADEIQAGPGPHWVHVRMRPLGHAVPDVYLLGKALGGGAVPVSAVVREQGCPRCGQHPGEHGSTFGGNPLAAGIGTTVVGILRRGDT